MSTASVFAPLGNLRRIGEKEVRINVGKILKLCNKEYVFRKETHKILFEKIKSLKGNPLKIARKILEKLEE